MPGLDDLKATAEDAEKAAHHADALWIAHEKTLIELGGAHIRALFEPDEDGAPGGTLSEKIAVFVRATECALLYYAAQKAQETKGR